LYKEFIDPRKRDVRGLRFMRILAETLARNVDRDKQRELFEWGCSLLIVPFQDGRMVESDLDQLHLAAQWAILERRETNGAQTNQMGRPL
jgi:hypothetical protein